MKTTKSLRRSLLTAVVSLATCATMFVGTTFAWFTDNVTSSNNIIQSGNLDVEMYWAEGTENPETATWADASTTAIFDYDNWEPGYVDAKHVKISNEGSLALQYKLSIVPRGEVTDLTDVIDVYYTDPAAKVGQRSELLEKNKLGTLTEVLAGMGEAVSGVLEAGQDDVITLVLKMQEDAGNEYMNKSIGKHFAVHLFAAQLAYEEDSFDNKYNVTATYADPRDFGYEVIYIYDLEDFTEFGRAVNSNGTYDGVKVANNNNLWIEVMNDIDMTDAPAIQGTEFSIGNGNNLQFTGVFDGNDHVISNYSISAGWTYNVSLFRTVSGAFTMRDVTFVDCFAEKTNNREASMLVGTIGGGKIIFDNVDVKNVTINGVGGAAAYVGKMTEGGLYFYDCDVENVTLNATSATGKTAMFLCDGYSHHDYAESGVWVENCTIKNSKSVINAQEESAVKEYNYTK